MTSAEQTPKPFHLDFSNRVVEHLGIKLYQNRPTNVVAEFVSNCWDADAANVRIRLLQPEGPGRTNFVISDDGRGMTREELTDAFLVIGHNKRSDPSEKTLGGRNPMGRKGIGKLAGFGIAGVVDVVSIPNQTLRKESPAPALKIYWLRFKLDEMLKSHQGYSPIVIADGVDLLTFTTLLEKESVSDIFSELLNDAREGKGGVSIYLHETSLKKSVDPDALLKAIGIRFTVTLLRPDFIVTVNEKRISPEDALPPFLEYGFGTLEAPLSEKIMIEGVEREVRYWTRFVSLKETDWPLENAGVGIYAHGKIAQDRPFFFGIRGKEIFSRYLYGVVEADWLDEMPEDVVSTDRRSVNWDTEPTAQFHEWGAKKIAAWVDGFRQWRTERAEEDTVEKIRAVTSAGLSGPEEEALAKLLSEVLPNFGNNEELKVKAIQSFADAWTHEPTRKLTKSLWEQVFAEGDVDVALFPKLIEQLKNSLVPEALSLAVTMAQRVAAITAMTRMIEREKTETHLQRLVEEFPWLLGPEWEHLTSNQTIRTLVREKHQPNESAGEWSLTKEQGNLKPDFVFLSDVGAEKEIIVFELKGPECGKTLQVTEYHQLRAYLDIIRGVYANRENLTVRGVLVGHDKGGFELSDNRITVTRWTDVLLAARKLHVSYLASLLKTYEPGENDARLRQISDFGGKETVDLLERLKSVADFSDVVEDALWPEDASE